MAALLAPIPPASHQADTGSGSAIRLVEPRARILSVSANRADHAILRRIVEPARWRFAAADTCDAAIRELRRRPARVVFCESILPDGTWKDLLDRVSLLDDQPRFAVISGNADELLWFEVLDRGGYDVLSKPLDEDEVRNVLGALPRHPVDSPGRPRLSLVRVR
jgi:DNA-binding NtrC family response regulator